jgi:hypothetical protein
VPSEEVTNTNDGIWFDPIGLEPTIYRIRAEYTPQMPFSLSRISLYPTIHP